MIYNHINSAIPEPFVKGANKVQIYLPLFKNLVFMGILAQNPYVAVADKKYRNHINFPS